MNVYPHKAEQFINEAKISLSRMKTSKTFYEVKQAFLSFLNASRFAFQSWKKDFKDVEGFEDWWNIKAQKLENDDLCKFFRDLRNKMMKEGAEPFWVSQNIRGPVVIQGRIQIGPQGVLKGSIKGGRPKWDAIAIEGVETVIGFKETPEGYKELGPFEICEKYLEILDGIVDDFVNSFNKN